MYLFRHGNDDHSQPHSNEAVLQELMRRIGARLPSQPAHFAPREVALIMDKMHQELEGYVSQRLKDIYVEMTSFDRKLSGLIHFDDFVFAAKKHQVCFFQMVKILKKICLHLASSRSSFAPPCSLHVCGTKYTKFRELRKDFVIYWGISQIRR